MRFIGFYDYTVILTHLSLASAINGIIFSGQGPFAGAMVCLLGACAFLFVLDIPVKKPQLDKLLRR